MKQNQEETHLELWEAYRIRGDPQARMELYKLYSHFVRILFYKIRRNFPTNKDLSYTLEDALASGNLAMLEQMAKFDYRRGIRFETFASKRIVGAMIDELRRQDWLPRKARTKKKKIERVTGVLQVKLGRMPTDYDIAKFLDVDVDTIRNWQTLAGMEIVFLDDDSNGLSEKIEDSRQDQYIALARSGIGELFHIKLQELPSAERTVIMMHYYENRVMEEIGKHLGLTNSRVYQIREKALKRLRKALAWKGIDSRAIK
ncbi:MAG: sigma-70 family RNA polymerase sigma factor [Patescibacteria group bacterium]|jgi:RNA polymerase sigma factor for flagellar operon FliA